MKLYNTLEPFAVGYLNADKYEDVGYKIGMGLYHQACHMPLYIKLEDFYAMELDLDNFGVRSIYANTIMFDGDRLKQEMEDYPRWKEELQYIYEKMEHLDGESAVYGAFDEEERVIEVACWGGTWGGHGNPGYDDFLKLGTKGILAKIAEYRGKNPGKEAFYEGCELSMKALEVLAERYARTAERMLVKCKEENRAHLERILKCFRHCPVNPPRDFFEACQMFWLCYLYQGPDSPGRFDQYMIDYYRKSDPVDARICMEKLWELFHVTRTWNLCIGGSDKDWKDETNELTYLILELTAQYKYQTPNLTMRVHRNTPEELWDAAIRTISAGTGMPVIYNDECVCPALESIGIPAGDAHEYCMNGCNQIDIIGKSHMGLEDGEVNLAKCMELTLFEGVCQIDGKQVAPSQGDCEKFVEFQEFFDAFKRMVEYVTDKSVSMSNKAQKVYAEIVPNPFRSCLIRGCIEKGRDYKDGGPLYGHGQILAEGIADAADSLAAVRYYVYETKKYSMQELKAALKADFEGYEALYTDFSTFRKFGNDDDYVDGIAAEMIGHFFGYLRTKETYRGGVFTGGCSPFSRVAGYGKKVRALPNGKKKFDCTLADSIGAVPGNDINGITALMNSVLKYPHHLAGSGFILNLKLNKSIFEKERGNRAVKDLFKTFFAGGGQQLSPSVVSREELEDAMIHPEKHRNLIVRVGGYSDYFVDLGEDLQRNVLMRSYQDV